jgi:uncharacterized protein
MAHQCLQCGQTFPDGSQELLKGCPKCQGTRFFYTQAPLARQEREALMQQANKDLRGILQELVQGGTRPTYDDPVWSQEAREKWLQVDARKLHAHEPGAVREVKAPEGAPAAAAKHAPAPRHAGHPHPHPHPTRQAELPWADAPAPAEEPPAPAAALPARARTRPPAPLGPEMREAKPEVVVVNEPGRYDIDVQQLMEKSPVVVRRDGVYVVHLPSVFEAAAKK